MVAEGGNNEIGAWKEKRALRRDDRDSSAKFAVSASRGCAVRRERNVRNVGNAIKLRSRRRSRGGRILPLRRETQVVELMEARGLRSATKKCYFGSSRCLPSIRSMAVHRKAKPSIAIS